MFNLMFRTLEDILSKSTVAVKQTFLVKEQ